MACRFPLASGFYPNLNSNAFTTVRLPTKDSAFKNIKIEGLKSAAEQQRVNNL